MLEIDLKIILHSFYTHPIIFNSIYCQKMKSLSKCFPVVLNRICKTNDKHIRGIPKHHSKVIMIIPILFMQVYRQNKKMYKKLYMASKHFQKYPQTPSSQWHFLKSVLGDDYRPTGKKQRWQCNLIYSKTIRYPLLICNQMQTFHAVPNPMILEPRCTKI